MTMNTMTGFGEAAGADKASEAPAAGAAPHADFLAVEAHAGRHSGAEHSR